jgi:HD-GYP domain-containing protein (c-di-GMP phosphodiesterase class II)
MDAVIEFLEYVESQPRQSVSELLDRILLQSRKLTGAEAGTIFIARRGVGKRWLEAARAQNDRTHVGTHNFVVPIPSPTIAGYVAETGTTLIVDDVYKIPKSRPYSFNPSFERAGYRTRSMMCFPLKNHDGVVVGVVQLINRRLKRRAGPVVFDKQQARLIAPIARVVAGVVERTEMMERIRQKNLELSRRNKALAESRAQIETLQTQTEEAFMLSIELLARAAEIHDEGTGNHIVRVNEYSFYLAQLHGQPDAFCREIRYSAQLHDVGKMSVDAAVLKKKGGLNDAERAKMNNHVVYGKQILERSPRLRMAAEIAIGHHEKWDGSGYPNGLRGEDIPIAARIVAVADVYDALRAERPYKPGFTHERTMDIMLNGDNHLDPKTHFDPALLDLLRDNHQGMAEIWDRLHD